MKTKSTRIRISPDEEKLLKRAAIKLQNETGSKPMASRTILHSLKEYANKPAELYFCDRKSIKALDINIEWGRAKLQTITDEFLALTKQTLTMPELQNMFIGLGKLGSTQIIESAIQETVLLKSYKALKEKHPDMELSTDNVKPKDMTALFRAADDLQMIPDVNVMDKSVVHFNCYQFKENQININPEAVELIKDQQFRFFATTPSELQKLSKVKTLCECLNSFLDDKEVIPEKIFTMVYFDQESKRFSPSGAYVKFNVSPNILFTR